MRKREKRIVFLVFTILFAMLFLPFGSVSAADTVLADEGEAIEVKHLDKLTKEKGEYEFPKAGILEYNRGEVTVTCLDGRVLKGISHQGKKIVSVPMGRATVRMKNADAATYREIGTYQLFGMNSYDEEDTNEDTEDDDDSYWRVTLPVDYENGTELQNVGFLSGGDRADSYMLRVPDDSLVYLYSDAFKQMGKKFQFSGLMRMDYDDETGDTERLVTSWHPYDGKDNNGEFGFLKLEEGTYYFTIYATEEVSEFYQFSIVARNVGGKEFYFESGAIKDTPFHFDSVRNNTVMGGYISPFMKHSTDHYSASFDRDGWMEVDYFTDWNLWKNPSEDYSIGILDPLKRPVFKKEGKFHEAAIVHTGPIKVKEGSYTLRVGNRKMRNHMYFFRVHFYHEEDMTQEDADYLDSGEIRLSRGTKVEATGQTGTYSVKVNRRTRKVKISVYPKESGATVTINGRVKNSLTLNMKRKGRKIVEVYIAKDKNYRKYTLHLQK